MPMISAAQGAVAGGGQPELSASITLFHPISTRDGTLTKDAKLVNFFAEPSENGNAVVKRPGLSLFQQNPVGVGQGQFMVNGNPYSIVGDTIYRTGSVDVIAIPLVTVPNQQYQVLSDTPFGTTLLKSASGLWTFDGVTAVKVVDPNYPALTVFGLCYLDGGYYVMDPDGSVRGSAFEDPTTWPALNFVAADVSLGKGVGVNRHLNYIEAIYQSGMQLYYDAGTSPGSPLAAVSNASWKTGCAAGNSIVEFGDETYYMSKPTQKGRGFLKLEGLALSIISNPYIEKILNRSTLAEVHSFAIKTAGHSFYCCTLVDLNITLVYDTILTNWSLWSSKVSGVEGLFVGVNYLNANSEDLFQSRLTGEILEMDPAVYTDTSGPIRCLARTKAYDWGMLKNKFLPELYLLADTISTTVTVSYSDDDYTSYSTARSINMSTVKKMLQRCGSSRRRSWDVVHEDNTPMRIFGMEVNPIRGAG